MTQLSGIPFAVEQQRDVFVLRQRTFHFVELAVRKTDGSGNVAFVILGPFGS